MLLYPLPPMLKEALRGVLEEKELLELSSAFDVIGDIAIVKIPSALEAKKELIGQQLLTHMRNVRTVLNQVSDVAGEYRLRELAFVSGVERYETLYKESGCVFKVNVRDAYFSPRLSTERLRIAGLAHEGERIFNMFAGLGTFSILIAKRKRCIVDSVDKNPEAIRLAFDSLKMNRKLLGVVRPVLADAAAFAKENAGLFDRVLMPLPERSAEFLDAALLSLKNAGPAMIHYYVHVPQQQFADPLWITHHLKEQLHTARNYRIAHWKKVREVGPRYLQAVADIAFS